MNRLRWQCRRGMLELDEVLSGYLEGEFVTSTRQQQDLFRELLRLEDPLLNEWLLMGACPSEPRFESLVRNIRSRGCRDSHSL